MAEEQKKPSEKSNVRFWRKKDGMLDAMKTMYANASKDPNSKLRVVIIHDDKKRDKYRSR